ncbi:esterase-like activity of phytase family protein [Coleofasciculus sp. FACHB-501]|uniref:esterase-like activity of phytase family protein n=1 Tax=Cyanophyceae TaxID=3028117 RepID=UPI00321F9848
MNGGQFRPRSWVLGIAIALLTFVTSCGVQPGMTQDRVFLDLSLDFLGEYQLPKTKFKDTPVSGLSGLTYDRKQNRFYAISDDRSKFAPARFYTLNMVIDDASDGKIGIQKVEVENVTFLTKEDGNTYPKSTVDTEGIAVSPQQSVFISSEGVARDGIPPFIGEFDLKTGRLRQNLPIPERYLPDVSGNTTQTRGIQNNLGFEALTLNPVGTLPAAGEPFRLFTATESSLMQDSEAISSKQGAKCRILHYLLSDGPPLLIAEHLYAMEPPPSGALKDGLPEFLSLDAGGHFLTLERSLSLLGYRVRIYQAAMGGATDISSVPSLKGELTGIEPVKKKLLLDLDEIGIPLGNLEGMTFGPRLPDGSQSLLLVSDDNFQDKQTTQFLLFRLKSKR